MREDYLEKLDAMFPNGYVIVYTCPNQTIRLGLYNPSEIKELDKVNNSILNSGIYWERSPGVERVGRCQLQDEKVGEKNENTTNTF